MNKDNIEIFEKDGILAEQIDGYEEREEQIAMANDLDEFIDSDKRIFIGEGAVGIGKSMVYLLTSLIGKDGLRGDYPVVVSTSSITLQNQLTNKDLPDAKEIIENKFDEEIKFCSLKGINNYLCLKKYHQLDLMDEDKDSRKMIEKKMDTPGYKGEKPDKIEYGFWQKITSSSNECTKNKCPYYNECFYTRKKKQSNTADVLAINHSLLAADIYIRKITGGSASVLPHYNTLIIDEVHEFEDSCTSFFTKTLSSRVIKKLYTKLNDLGEELYEDEEIPKNEKEKLADKLDFAINFANEIPTEELIEKIETIARDNMRDLIKQTYDLEEYWINPFDKLYDLVSKIRYNEFPSGELVQPICVSNFLDRLDDFIKRLEWLNNNEESVAIWADGGNKYPKIKLASINIDEFLEDFWTEIDKIVMTSATIAVNKSFDFIKDRLGIKDKMGVDGGIYKSPFDYENQAKLIVPKHFNPKSDSFNEKVLYGIQRTIDNGYDKTLILFTSYRQMSEVAPKIKLEYSSSHLVLEQSKNLSKAFILNKFRNAEKSILIAQAASFGTGVDVKGDKNIILVKLNFDNPTDPLFMARSEAIEEEGGNPFMDLSIPNVSIRTKQQLGRGIRSSNDKANMAILDGRVVKSYWGRKILRSLPDMKLFKQI